MVLSTLTIQLSNIINNGACSRDVSIISVNRLKIQINITHNQTLVTDTKYITYEKEQARPDLTVAINPLIVVNPLCNIRKKFLGFRALLNTAPQNGAICSLQSALYKIKGIYVKKMKEISSKKRLKTCRDISHHSKYIVYIAKKYKSILNLHLAATW